MTETDLMFKMSGPLKTDMALSPHPIAKGCICPPTSEQTCLRGACGRRASELGKLPERAAWPELGGISEAYRSMTLDDEALGAAVNAFRNHGFWITREEIIRPSCGAAIRAYFKSIEDGAHRNG